MKSVSFIAVLLTVLILFGMMMMLSGKYVSSRGVLFDLPSYSAEDGVITELVAMVFPSSRDTMVFFDDARYSLGDEESLGKFKDHLMEFSQKKSSALLVMADKRVTTDELMRVAKVAKESKIAKLLIAERKLETVEE